MQRSLDQMCGSFNLSYIDAWEFEREKWYINPGDEAELRIDDDLILTGYVDRVDAEISGDSKRYRVTGRDKTCDLVDCAAASAQFASYKNLSVNQLAPILARPFGIDVIVENEGTKKFPLITIEHGQTAFGALDSISKRSGVLLQTDERGRLRIALPGSRRASIELIEGQNVLSASVSLDHSGRFSNYYVYGDNVGDLVFFGKGAAQVKASASDAEVKRHRPRTIIAERAVTAQEATKRAQWEAKFNASRGTVVNIQVPGWRQGADASSPLWIQNALVVAAIPSIGVDGEFLIEAVRYILDEGGEKTELSLTRKDAWVPNPIVPADTNEYLNIGEL